jgi:hypothetical protein
MAGSTSFQLLVLASMSNWIWSAFKRKRGGLREEPPVEAQQLLAHDGAEATGVHGAPEVLEHRHEGLGLLLQVAEQLREAGHGQQLHILAEHGEEAAHEEAADFLGRVFAFEAQASCAKRLAISRVTFAERRLGSRLSGSVHTARRRSRISGRSRSFHVDARSGRIGKGQYSPPLRVNSLKSSML